MKVNSHKSSGRFVINPHDLVTFDGKVMRLAYATRDGYVLMDANGSGVSETFDFATLAGMNLAKKIKHEPCFFAPEAASRRLTSPVARVSGLSKKQKLRLRHRQAFVKAFLEMRDEGLVAANDVSIAANMPELCKRGQTFLLEEAPHPDIIQRENEIKQGLRRKSKGGVVVHSLAPVHARTLRSWLSAFEKFGSAGLADSIAKRGNNNSYFSPEERALLMSAVRKSYLSANQPTKLTTFNDVKRAFREENLRRTADGLTPLRVPSRETVRKSINGLDKFEVTLERKGLQEAVKLFKPVGRGLEIGRPYERVEMDEWKIDLITILADAGLLPLFSKEELADLGMDNGSGRWWVVAAIDCRTRCIVGMKLTLNPNACAALDCLKMTTSDKGQWADAVGAVSSWDMAATPETLVTDNGAAFKAGVFSDACADLGITHLYSIAGVPAMRGTVERLFRTTAVNLLPRLNGRTFSSVLERGDHPAETRACLTAEHLCFALVRWIVDIYHNTPHMGLGGRTPLEQWEEDISEGNFPLKSMPHVRDDRLAFGVELSRKLDKYGVTVCGVKYHSEILSAHFNKVGKQNVDIRWIADDIGAVEVRIDGLWYEASSVQFGLKGVHAQLWLATRRSLKTSDPTKLKWREDVVCDALTAIRNMNTQQSLEFGLISQKWNPDRIAKIEESLFAGFNVSKSVSHTSEPDGQFGRLVEPAKLDHFESSMMEMPPHPEEKRTQNSSWKFKKGDK